MIASVGGLALLGYLATSLLWPAAGSHHATNAEGGPLFCGKMTDLPEHAAPWPAVCAEGLIEGRFSPLFFCDFQSENAEIPPFFVHFTKK